MNKIPVNLKGTRHNFYIEPQSYKAIKKAAEKEGKTVEDLFYEAYEGSFFEAGIKLGEAMEDLAKVFGKMLGPTLDKLGAFFRRERRRYTIAWIKVRIKRILRIGRKKL